MTTLWRLHLRSLLTDGRTLLTVVGLAVGTALVVAVSVLATSTSRPFDTAGTLLGKPQSGRLVQIEPLIHGRLPDDLVTRVGTIDGVQVVNGVVIEPTPLLSVSSRANVLLVGTDGCALAKIARTDPCLATFATAVAAGPGVALSLALPVANALGVHPGDALALPGSRLGSAHVGWVRPAGAGTDEIVVAVNLPGVQALVGDSGTVTRAYAVVTDAAAQQRITAAVEGIATVTVPKPDIPVALVTVQQTLGTMRIAGIVVGTMIAVTTLLLAFDSRRQTIATAMLIGATTRRLVAGFIVEGIAVGSVGGLLGLPLGQLAGTFLVDQFANDMLAGTGASVQSHFEPSELVVAIGVGAISGLVAVLISSRGVIRQGIVANLDGSVGGLTTRRRIPWWFVPSGVGLIALGALSMKLFGRGRLPFSSGEGGLLTAIFGVVLITLTMAPRIARWTSEKVAQRFGVIGLSTRAEVDRLPLRTGVTVAVLAIGLALAIAFSSIGSLGGTTTTDIFAKVQPGGLMIEPQAPWDQREGIISNAVASDIRSTPGVTSVTERWRSILSSPDEPRLVLAIDGPGAERSYTPVQPFTGAISGDQIALSRVASGRLGATVGDRVRLPTLQGMATFSVVGVFDPVALDDSTIGDWVLVSPVTARRRFGAVRSQMTVEPAQGTTTVALASRLDRVAPGLVVLDRSGWERASLGSWSRWFRPFSITGYLIAASGGIAVMDMLLLSILQRRRTRAAMRAIGQTAAGERRTLLAQALVLAILATGFGIVWSQLFVWLLSLSSPVFYGFQLRWGVVRSALGWGTAVTLLFVLASVATPVVVANRLDVASSLNIE